MKVCTLIQGRAPLLTKTLFQYTADKTISYEKRTLHVTQLLTENSECKPKVERRCKKRCTSEIIDPKNKVALITGGTSGIGFQTANELLVNGACHVFITGIDTCAGRHACKELNATHGSNKCTYMHLNITCDQDFKDVFECVEERFGSVDILFNNAGILQDRKWELEVETNLKSAIRANLVGLKYMSNYKTPMPRIIINMSDVCALGMLAPVPIYTATSYGILGLTKCFGSMYHFKETGVRVVALCCGPTRTDLIKNVNKMQLTKKWGQDTFDMLTSKPLQKPDVVGKAVLYLIRYAQSNTIWTVESSQLYRTNFPKISSINTLITKLC